MPGVGTRLCGTCRPPTNRSRAVELGAALLANKGHFSKGQNREISRPRLCTAWEIEILKPLVVFQGQEAPRVPSEPYLFFLVMIRTSLNKKR